MVPATVADDDVRPGGDNAQESTQLLEKTVTLSKKSTKLVTAYAGDGYAIDKSTLIVGEDGQQILIQYLLVPCQAQLLYEERDDGSLYAHRIKVISIQDGATNTMQDPPR